MNSVDQAMVQTFSVSREKKMAGSLDQAMNSVVQSLVQTFTVSEVKL